MKTFKSILLSLMVLSQIACGGDSAEDEPSNTSKNDTQVKKGSVIFTMKSMADGNDKYRGDGCATEMLFINGLDEKVTAKILRYEKKHTKGNILSTGSAGGKTMKPGESKISNIFMGGFKCSEITGLEIQAVMCKTESGSDCSDKFNFVSTDKVKMTVTLQK